MKKIKIWQLQYINIYLVERFKGLKEEIGGGM